MAIFVELINPATGVTEKHTAQNASDLVQHCGWQATNTYDDGVSTFVEAQTVIEMTKSAAPTAKSAADIDAAFKVSDKKSPKTGN